jgi:hypothetical protein
LKLNDGQKKKAQEALKKNMASRQAVRDGDAEERGTKIIELNKAGEKEVASLLQADQARRFHQIYLQQLGVQAFLRPDVVKELSITGEQSEKIKTIQQETRKQMKGLRQPGADRAKVLKRMSELTKEGTKSVEKVFTAEQKAKWKEIAGAAFTGDVRFGPPDRSNDADQ